MIVIRYTHSQLGEDVAGRAGFYTAIEELTLPYRGRKVLYVMGMGRLERPCCGGAASFGYIQVPGFLVRKHKWGRGSATPASEVEIIEDQGDRAQIRQALLEKHPGTQVEIWDAHYAQEGESPVCPGPAEG